MRLWTIHPRYLDGRGLVALWRESLLAQRVLAGRTIGYRRHPQLARFRERDRPLDAIGAYLIGVADEAARRGYSFDRSRIEIVEFDITLIPATTGQIRFEWDHLMQKLRRRSPDAAAANELVDLPEVHPLFEVIDGPVADWERAAGG